MRALSAVALAAVLLLAGCAGRTGDVSGQVTLDGERVNFGTVAIQSANGKVASAMIKPDGTYSVTGVAPGDAVVTVQTYPLPPVMGRPDQPGPKGEAPPPALRYTPIPAVYGESARSPLKLTVKPGSQTFDL